MMEEFYFKKLSKENVRDLISVYKKSFGKDVTADYLIKKNSTENFGLSFCGYIAYSLKNSEPAAFYGVYPCHIKYNDKIYLVAQSGDTMTDPAYQGKGLFVRLATMTYDCARKNGVKFVFGFPNKNSYPGFVKKLNWQHFEDMHAYLIRVKCLTWLRLSRMFRNLSSMGKLVF